MATLHACVVVVLSLVLSAEPGADLNGQALGATAGTPRVSLNARGESPRREAPKKVRELEHELEEIQADAEAYLHKTEGGSAKRDPDWRIERYVELAENAKRAGVERELLESLIESAGADANYYLPWRSTRWSVVTGVWTALALSILEQNVGGKEKEFLVPSARRQSGPFAPLPTGVRGVLISWSMGGRGDVFGTALAAIDSYQDDRARDFLLWYALDTFEGKRGQASPFTAWALRFLSCYDPKPIKARIEPAYQAALQGRSLDLKSSSRYRDRRFDCLRVCLAHLQFADTLEPAPRKRFQRMLRLLEYTYALLPKGTVGGVRVNPAILFPSWKDGDERFLPHLLETGTDGAGGAVAKAPISANGLAWLKQQAESGDLPANVKAYLTKALRAREGVTEPKENKRTPKR